MKKTLSKHAFFEYLGGRANPLERQAAEDWIADRENAEAFHQWLLEYELMSPQFIPDQETAISALLQRLESDPAGQILSHASEENVPKKVTTVYGNRFWLIAASVLMVLSVGWWLREPLLYRTYQTAYGQTTDIYLEDGSKVALNANSSLKLPRFGFSGNVRKVFLEGEAEFMVSHTIDHKRFVVETSEKFQIEVLGTTFSVFSRPRGKKVALTSGSVRIDYSHDDRDAELLMEPGDLAFLDDKGEVQLEKKQDIKNFAAWKEQRYVFSATTVQDILAMLEENFGQKVTLSDSSIAHRTITGNFKTRSAVELLKTISEVLDMKIEQHQNTILLTTN